MRVFFVEELKQRNKDAPYRIENARMILATKTPVFDALPLPNAIEAAATVMSSLVTPR
jgi:hypothetical protein